MGETLVVISHWVHNCSRPAPKPRWDLGEPPDFRKKILGPWRTVLRRDPRDRLKTLLRSLRLIKEWPTRTRVVLVSNAPIPEVKDLAVQVVVEQPRCQAPKAYYHHWCLPWEALGILCQHGATNCSESGKPRTRWEAFAYFEDDILLSGDAFQFWRSHAEDLDKQGYFLVPHNYVLHEESYFLDPGFPCESVRRVDVWMGERGEAFFTFPALHGRGFLMTRPQFQEYIMLAEWHWASSSFPDKFWGMREGAYLAPLVGVMRRKRQPVSHLHFGAVHSDSFAIYMGNDQVKCRREDLQRHLRK